MCRSSGATSTTRIRTFSDLALSLEDGVVTAPGFMAPPLKAEAEFFVLTKMPTATCPFCESAAQWPDDILAGHTQRIVRPIPFDVAVETRGPLELGAKRDAEPGFIGRVRLVDAVCS